MKFKKAGSDDLAAMLYYSMVGAFILTILLFTYLFVVNGFKLNIVYLTRGIDESLLINRGIYSSNCFAYYDVETFRTYPSVIDIKKFNYENFEKCLNSNRIHSLALIDENYIEIKKITNPKVNEYTKSGAKSVYVYDNGLKFMFLEIKLNEEKS